MSAFLEVPGFSGIDTGFFSFELSQSLKVMGRSYKYDVAISFAEEDLPVAEKIARELKTKRISYYLYTENIAIHWGENIFKISYDTYSCQSKYVLLLISKTYIQKKWSNIERQITESVSSRIPAHILPVSIDDTPMDKLNRNIVFVKWENDAARIAGLIKEKLVIATRQRNRRSRKIYFIAFLLLVSIGGILLIKNLNIRSQEQNTLSGPFEEKKRDSLPGNKIPDTVALKDNKRYTGNSKIESLQPDSQKRSKTIIPVAQLYDYCIIISGNNDQLNKTVSASCISLINSRQRSISSDCRTAKTTISIYLDVLTTESETVQDIVSTSCNYSIDISKNKDGQTISDAGRLVVPGFNVQANTDKISTGVIKKINMLL